MTPLATLRAQGSPGNWLINSTRDHRDGQFGEFRYLITSLDTSAIADLAILALEGWTIRVNHGPSKGVRVTIRRATGRGVHASTTPPPNHPTRSDLSLPEGVPHHARVTTEKETTHG